MTKKAPPKKCPDCGRFLRKIIYEDLKGKVLGSTFRCVKVTADEYHGGALEHG